MTGCFVLFSPYYTDWPSHSSLYGMMTAIVSSTEELGDIILEATAKGLKKATVTIKSF